MISDGLCRLCRDLAEMVTRVGDTLQNVLEVTGKALGLGDGATGQRSGRNYALQGLGVLGAHQPDPMALDELNVVAASPQDAGILIRADDPVAALVHIEQDVFIEPEIVAVGNRATELLLGEPLDGFA